MTFNQALIATMITRQIDLLRYEKAVRADVFAVLDNIQHDISVSLKLPDIEKTVTNGYALILNALDVLPVLDAELLWLSATIGGLAAAYGLRDRIVPLAKKSIHALANQFTVGGLKLTETITKQRNDLTLKLKSLIRSAAIDDRLPEMDEITDVFNRAKQTAQTMTRTWINSVAHTAHEAFARVNPLIKGYRHISVLDSGTTALCTHRQGLLWDKKHNPIGHVQIFKRPPLHYNCRSKLVYVYDLKEEFDGFSGDDWVKSRSLEQLQEQFGKGIGQMLFNGQITLADALDGLKPLTLKQLQEKLGLPETVIAIGRKHWTEEFKNKSIQHYYQFAQAGFELDIHGVSRLSRLQKNGFVAISVEQVLDFLKNNRPEFHQETDDRLVFFSKELQIAVVQSQKDSKIITIVRMKKAKAEWKTLTKS